MMTEAYAREALAFFTERAKEERRDGDHEYAETLENAVAKWRETLKALKETK